ncbi:MAG: hypothetical protein IPO68_10445 [Chitinophagaceae bacterium]|nr:hypothetical protein [Chitinophagaceae bacterium]
MDAGTYHESASNRYVFGVNGPHKFGLFIDKDNLLIEGLDASNNTVTSAGNAAAVVTTNATNNFGASGIFVQANGVTIKGLKIGNNYNDANAIDNNKTFEIVGDNFTLDKTWISTASDEGAVYMGRWDAAHPISSYSLTNNKFENTLISINNGIGLSGPRASRVITGNEFVGVATPYLIGFRGWNGAGPVQGWIVDPVGGAVVTGNTFNTTGVVNYIVARGNAGGYVNSELDWSEMWNMNTYGNHVVTLTNYPGFDVRTYTDGAGYPQTRRISPAIQENIDIAAAGDAVLVSAGTFNESLNVNKSVSLIGAQAGVCAPTRAGAESIINSVNGNGINASGVTINGFTIQGQTSAAGPGFGYALYMAPGNTGTKLLNNIIKDNVIGSSLSNQGASPAQVQITCNWFKNNNNPGSATGSGIYTDEYTSGGIISNVLINNNKFSGNNSAGIDHSTTQAAMASTGISIDGNEFSNNNRATFLYNLTNSSFTNNEVSGSTFAGSGDLRIYAGVHNFNVTNNKFAAGTDVRAIRISTDGVENNSGITVNYNSFTGYTSTNKAIEIVSGYPGTLAGTCNWFGTTVPATVAAQLSASVNHVPYLTSGVDISPAVSGFQTNEVCATCALVATPSSTNVTCPTQADGTASVTLTGGTGPYTYDWGVYGSTQTITGLAIGSYPVTVTDINGCVATTTAVVGDIITGPVLNTNTGLYFCTIQAAIDHPLTFNSHLITAAAGLYNEDVVVNKSVTIQLVLAQEQQL